MPGLHDSSITRVAPVFTALDEGGYLPEALDRLLSLPERDGQAACAWGDAGTLEEKAWFPKEKRLSPPRSLLEYLVEALPGTGRSSKRPDRAKLLAGDEEALAEAMTALREETVPPRAWFVFEGPTSVDAYLRTTRYVVLVEGKRTEAGPTTHTSWMEVRHQVLRNIDAAWDSRGDRDVVAFFAVEGAAPDPTTVSRAWREAVAATTSPDALAGSLPHRSATVRSEMAEAFRGAVTWQAICREFSLPTSTLIDEVPVGLR